MHKPGALNKADGLSKRIDHKEGMNDDNEDKIILDPKKFFRALAVGQGNTSEDPVIARTIRTRTTQAIQLVGNTELKEQIIKCQELDDKVASTIHEIKSNGPRFLGKGLQEWNYEDGLILFRGKIYVPKNIGLQRNVVRSCHNPIIMGHLGQFKTQEIVQRNFWWPGMSIFIKSYVDGCLTCQETKNITHPTKIPLQLSRGGRDS
jgi:hypothetical protein